MGADEKHFSARFPLLGVAGSGLGAYWRGCFRQGDAVVSCGGGEGSAGISYLRERSRPGLLERLKLFMSVCRTEGTMQPTGNAKHAGGLCENHRP